MADEALALGVRAADRLTVPSNAAVAAAKQVARAQLEIATELRDRPTVAERVEARSQAVDEARARQAEPEDRRVAAEPVAVDAGRQPETGQRATVVNIVV